MISIRSALSRSSIARRNPPFAASAAFVQSTIPFVTSSSSEQSRADNGRASSASVRCMSSPAYRRYQKKEREKEEEKRIREEKREFSRYRIPSELPGIQEPCKNVAKAIGETFSEMDNEPLLIIAEMGSFSAREEILKRNIMAVDDVNYEKASETLKEIEKMVKCGRHVFALPYRIGIFVGLAAGIGIIILTYHHGVADFLLENGHIVMDLDKSDAVRDHVSLFQTAHLTNEWLGPFTGSLSFSMLCFQYVRHQMINLGYKPVTERFYKYRTQKLIKAYPKYSQRLLESYVRAYGMVK